MARDDFEELAGADDQYHESSDEDFNPTAAPPSDVSSSSSEDEAAEVPAKGKGKGKGKAKGNRKRKAPEPEEFDSGDEKTIEAARKKKAKRSKGAKAGEEDDLIFSDDEGGEGGLIKTRAQRRVEEKERKPLARTDGATIDVDAIWAQMTAAPLRPQPTTPRVQEQSKSQSTDVSMADAAPVNEADETDLVSVKKLYIFAGQTTTEEKQIPRRLLEQYLTDGWKTVDAEPQNDKDDAPGVETSPKIRRPLRRPSRFDPNPEGLVKGLPDEYQLRWPRKGVVPIATGQENEPATEGAKPVRPAKGQKLNVVDKSRLDWTGFVEKEGIREDLAAHEKTKESYLGRVGFLASVEAKAEEERLRVRQKATAAKYRPS